MKSLPVGIENPRAFFKRRVADSCSIPCHHLAEKKRTVVKEYISNYDERDKTKKIYTSQVAESHVDALINARHKKTRKMQWTREGAHHVLQIRAMIASEEWKSKWQNAVLSALKAAV